MAKNKMQSSDRAIKREMLIAKLAARSRAASNGCIIWTGRLSSDGYGTLGDHLASRLAWRAHHGPIPKGMCVCHNCPAGDDPSCINPDHLWLGTHAENMADMKRKGRRKNIASTMGEGHGNAVLTTAQALEIRASAGPLILMAKKFNIAKSAVCKIRNGIAWAHLSKKEEKAK